MIGYSQITRIISFLSVLLMSAVQPLVDHLSVIFLSRMEFMMLVYGPFLP
jgi:hypothetical protein